MPEISSGEYYTIGEKQHKTEAASFLKPILDKQLTVDEIDNYADVAIDGLVSLVNKKVREYQFNHVTGDWDDKTVEDKALEFYGLKEVDTYLDFLSTKEREIKNIGKTINNRINHNNKVLVPPDKQNFSPIEIGSGEGMEDKKIINRTKAILFILKEDFGVDIDNEQQLSLDDGVIKDNMMRKISYVLIKCPTIERSILVCDEEGNASYVLNDAILKNQNISNDSLASLTKTELNALITENPQLGKRVIYSENGFVPRIIEAIKHPNSNIPDIVTAKMEDTGKYLYPKATENEVPVTAFAKSLGIAPQTVNKVIETIPAEELGKIEMRKFVAKVVGALTPKQQEVIIKHLKEKNLLVSRATENELSCVALADKLKISQLTVAKIIKKILPEEMGNVAYRKIGTTIAKAYTVEQQEIIIKYLEKANLFAPKASENELSRGGFAAKLKIGNDVLSKIIDKIPAEELGEVNIKRFGSVSTNAYTVEQQEIIIKHLEKANLFAPKASENELSAAALAKSLRIADGTINKILEIIPTEELGEVNIRRGGGVPTNAYTVEQQEIIIKYLKKENVFVSKANDNELSATALAKSFGISPQTVNKVINTIPAEKLGDVAYRRFGLGVTRAYNSEQQAIIISHFEKENVFIPKANDNELSVNGLADKWRITDRKKITKIINTIPAEKLGDVVYRRFGNTLAMAYNPEQQAVIKKRYDEWKK